MTKIHMSLLRLYALVFFLFSIQVLILNISHASMDKFLYPFGFFVIVMIPFEILDRFRKSGVYFDEKGISWRVLDEIHFKDWSELVINKKINLRYIKILNLNIKHKEKNLTILLFWPTEKDILLVTQKYVPKNHEFFNIVSDYSQSRGLKL